MSAMRITVALVAAVEACKFIKTDDLTTLSNCDETVHLSEFKSDTSDISHLGGNLAILGKHRTVVPTNVELSVGGYVTVSGDGSLEIAELASGTINVGAGLNIQGGSSFVVNRGSTAILNGAVQVDGASFITKTGSTVKISEALKMSNGSTLTISDTTFVHTVDGAEKKLTVEGDFSVSDIDDLEINGTDGADGFAALKKLLADKAGCKADEMDATVLKCSDDKTDKTNADNAATNDVSVGSENKNVGSHATALASLSLAALIAIAQL